MNPAYPGDAVVELTRALVGIDSVSPSLAPGAAGESAIADVVADRLAAAGFEVRTVEAAVPGRPSVVATRTGSGPGRSVVLNGHLDTVGVEGMDDPFGARIAGERMLGRGTSDMKGGVAGLIVAAERLAASDAPGLLTVALVSDEEDGSVGATAVLADLASRGETADVCLIAEPTWLDLAVAHRGYAVVRVTISGRAAHSSQPDEAVDVMPAFAALLAAIEAAGLRVREGAPHPLLGHGSLMATVARAGTAPFTVAARAEVIIERRTLPGEAGAAALDEVRALVGALAAEHGAVTWEVDQVIARDAWEADAAGPAAELADLLAAALGAPGRTGAPYWMESALWQAAGIPAVVCGPAGGGLHAVDEWVDLGQLRRFPVVVERAVRKFLTS
ncbi:MAG: M20/M25/M40 family metallo-hydrolase [Schumannella sp.]|nr:M20/M25/M40 family metallo-hydrolase [Microbacteriaceae bacterium]